MTMKKPESARQNEGLGVPPTEVELRPKRRRFTLEYKRRIIREADACTEPGQIGALLRREGLYSSALTRWRRQLQASSGGSQQERGSRNGHAEALRQHKLEIKRLKRKLAKAETIIEGQTILRAIWDRRDRPGRIALMQALTMHTPAITKAEACRWMGVSRSRFYRAMNPKPRSSRRNKRHGGRRIPVVERERIRAVLNSERFYDMPPRQIYATLLDEGCYLCHWRTMYRILAERDEVGERRNQRQHPPYRKPELLATGPNQLWSWDITKLRGPQKWVHYSLYVIMDVYSRYVVGWAIAPGESGLLAHTLIETTCRRQGIAPNQLVIHSDRGSAMTSKTVAQLLVELGIDRSLARPYNSNDNPYSEAQFKTMKYRPTYPERFGSLEHAKAWASRFFHWYNHGHYHTGLALMLPAVVHYGEARAVRAARQRTLREAYRKHPERFPNGVPYVPLPPRAAWINKPKDPHPYRRSSQRESSPGRSEPNNPSHA